MSINPDKIPKSLIDRFRKRLYTTDHEVGENNVQVMGMDIHNPVFGITALLVLTFVVFTLAMPELANTWLNGAKGWVVNTFDWFMVSASNLFVLFCLLLILSPYGSIRIGGIKATPDFSRMSWLSMLFAAGMGIGLMFWSVAEPLGYATGWAGTPLGIEPGTPEAYKAAMGATMYHWGLHPWAIYATVGLSLALFAFNFRFPLTLPSVFYPIFKEKTWGLPGHIIDILAVLATIFGLATSLGLGAQQAAGGLKYLFGIDLGVNVVEMIIIAVVTMLATLSVYRGLDGGVKILSNFNMLVALLLLLFIFIVSNPLQLIGQMFGTGISYATHILPLSNPVGRTGSVGHHL